MSDVPPVGGDWRRLDPRMLVVGPLKNLMQLLPFLLIVLFTGRSGDLNQVWFAVGGAAVVVLAGVLRWRTTRYRITDERVELHTGWLRRQRRSVPRNRIRTVDLTASPLHRVFGLSVVQVGSATGGASALDRSARMDLDAVSTAEAERLRRELLDRTSVSAPPVQRPAVEIASLDWSWLRFAPLTFSSLAGMGAVAGAAFNLLSEAGVDPRDIGVVDDTARRVATAPLWVGVGNRRRGAAGRRGARIAPAVRRALVRLPAHPGARTGRCGCDTACSPRARCRCRTNGSGGPR